MRIGEPLQLLIVDNDFDAFLEALREHFSTAICVTVASDDCGLISKASDMSVSFLHWPVNGWVLCMFSEVNCYFYICHTVDEDALVERANRVEYDMVYVAKPTPRLLRRCARLLKMVVVTPLYNIKFYIYPSIFFIPHVTHAERHSDCHPKLHLVGQGAALVQPCSAPD